MGRNPKPIGVVRVLAPITLDHIALQAEMLVHEIHALRQVGLEQRDLNQLHRMVADCLLFISPGENHG